MRPHRPRVASAALLAALAIAGGVGAALLQTVGTAPRAAAEAAPRTAESSAARRAAADALDRASAHLADAAATLVAGVGSSPESDVAAARAAIAEAMDASDGVTPRRARSALGSACSAADRRCVRAESSLAARGDGAAGDADALRAILDAGTSVRRAARLAGAPGVLAIRELGAVRRGPRRPGDVVRLRVLRAPGCDEDPVVMIEPDDPLIAAIGGFVTALGGDRYRIVLGDDAGTATVTASACGDTATFRIVNAGERDVLGIEGPGTFSYAAGIDVRVGDSVDAVPTYTGGGATFSISPTLPAGLTFDTSDGSIGGSPVAASPAATFTVVARNVRGVRRATVAVTVEEALPAGVVSLERGFRIENVTDADTPVRLALAPDGRVFYGELLSGNVRVIASDGTLLATPYATLPVLTGGERGLLGLCLAPDFATSGHLYVAASAAAGDGHPARNRVVRFTGTGDVATSGPDVIVDDLPIGDTQNGGAVEFGPDGMLYVTVGDTGDELLAQSDASRAGRVLRFTPDGEVPGDGPIQDSPEFARGFRNPFDITFHPSTGGLFASENGPTAHDELDFVQRGKNFEWGAEPEAIPGPVVGRRIIDWTPVIVPTGIVFHDGTGFGAEYADNLFVAGYDKGDVRRLVLSGPSYSDLDAEIPFLAFDEADFGLKPLDIQRGADGSLWVATFTAIWRISRNAP